MKNHTVNVAGIEVTSIFDIYPDSLTIDNLVPALTTTMRAAYSNGNFPPNADIVHALLGRKIGGGIAYIGELCEKDYGLGISSAIQGDFNANGQSTVWDIYVST